MIYLDHAATSYPKPEAVAAAVQHWFSNVGVSAERGDGLRTREASATVTRARQGISALTGHVPDRIAFCSGATEGLNLALRAVLTQGCRVLTTPFEHSSVARPLMALQEALDLQLDVVTIDDGSIDDALCGAIEANAPSVLVFSHASNVTGAVFDAQRVCSLARAHGTTTILDACQTAGCLPIDVGADVIISSGHKALHGPPGIGFVSARQDLELLPQKQGGTGSSRALSHHPTKWPHAFEAGTPNSPALFGLAAALDWIAEQGSEELLKRSLTRLNEAEAALSNMPRLRLLAPNTKLRVPVLSFVHEDYDPLEIGSILATNDIHVRTGFHCAPWIHEHLRTTTTGTVRISTGPETSEHDVQAFLTIMRSL